MWKRVRLTGCLIFLLIFTYGLMSLCADEPNIQYIRRAVFHGNKALDEKALSALLDIKPGQKFDPHSIENALLKILAEYKKHGYMFAKVEWERRPAENDQVALNIMIHEGDLIRMGEIRLSDVAAFSEDQLLDEFNIRGMSVFDDSVFQEDMDRLLEFYSDNGYPLARITPTEFRIENGRMNIGIDIDEGNMIKIDRVEISGLKKTRKEVVLREISVRPGDVFRQTEIDKSQQRLNNLGYFKSVEQASFSQAGDDAVVLNFPVTEGRTGRFSGLLGYNPSEEDIEGQKFTGLLEATETNLLGTGRKISIRGKFGLTDTYEFAYEEPWILGAPVGVGIRAWGTNQTDAFTKQEFSERAASLIGMARVIRFLEGSLAATYKQIKSPEASDQLLTGRKYSLTFSIQRDSRDYFMNPSAGRLDHTAIEVSRGDFRTVKLWLDMSQYFKTRKRQVMAIGLHGARVWGEKIPITEMLYLGGANTLRGYSEDFFRGKGTLFANSEYRFLVGRNSQFFFFLDGGSVYSEGNGLGPLKLGYGLGMRLESRTGLVSMDYGVARGDSVLNGKVHVSLGASF